MRSLLQKLYGQSFEDIKSKKEIYSGLDLLPDVLWIIIYEYIDKVYEMESETDYYYSTLTVIDKENILIVNSGNRLDIHDLYSNKLYHSFIFFDHYKNSCDNNFKSFTFYSEKFVYSYVESRKDSEYLLYTIDLHDGSFKELNLEKNLLDYYGNYENDYNILGIENHKDMLYIHYHDRYYSDCVVRIDMKIGKLYKGIKWDSRHTIYPHGVIFNNEIRLIDTNKPDFEIDIWDLELVHNIKQIKIIRYKDSVYEQILSKLNSYSLDEKYYSHIKSEKFNSVDIIDDNIIFVYKINKSLICLLLNINSSDYVNLLYIKEIGLLGYCKYKINIAKKYILTKNSWLSSVTLMHHREYK
jgi:hypothetical protein